MTKNEIRELVIQTIAADSGKEAASLELSDDLLDDLNLDSLAIYEVIVDLETSFDLQISDDDVDRLRTITDIVEYIDKRVNKPKG